jgi:hypothetical protein
MSSMLTELPYRKLPGLRAFLLDVRAQTKEGDAIAIAAPLHRAARWEGGYDYLYARALYLLAGRRVIPLVDPGDRPHPENVANAQWIAAYRSEPAVPNFATVWRGRDGVLLRRLR